MTSAYFFGWDYTINKQEKNCMTTSESKGRFFYKTNRFESIRITNRIDSNRELECSTGYQSAVASRFNSCAVIRQVAREFTRLKSECRDEEIGEWTSRCWLVHHPLATWRDRQVNSSATFRITTSIVPWVETILILREGRRQLGGANAASCVTNGITWIMSMNLVWEIKQEQKLQTVRASYHHDDSRREVDIFRQISPCSTSAQLLHNCYTQLLRQRRRPTNYNVC